MQKKFVLFCGAATCFLVVAVLLSRNSDRGYALNGTLISANNGQGGGQGNNGGGNNGGGNGGNQGGGQGNQGVGGGVGGGKENNRGNDKGDKGGGSVDGPDQGKAGTGGGGHGGTPGRGLRQHTAVVRSVLERHGVKENIPRAHPAPQKNAISWTKKVHTITCSMYQYLKRLREKPPYLRNDYVEWITNEMARALGEDPVEMRAALLGYPHDHDHTSTLLKAISDKGCAAEGETSALRNEKFAEQHSFHEHETMPNHIMTAVDRSTNQTIDFSILMNGALFNDYGISHEKEMHLLVVRDDLRHFEHLHPMRDAEGNWTLSFTPPAGGNYQLYADFTDMSGNHHTVRIERRYEGETGDTGFMRDLRNEKIVGPFKIIMEASPYSAGTLFSFHIDYVQGGTPAIEPYLGAMGHGILISPKGDLIHTHSSIAGDHLTFHVINPAEDFYRIFTQFQVQQQIYTVEFDWIPRVGGRRRIPPHTH